MTVDLRAAIDEVKHGGRSRMLRCPGHDDKTASLSISLGDKGVVFHCHANCERDILLAAVLAETGMTWADLFTNGNGHQSRKVVAAYSYTDENGKPLYDVLRYEPKGFSQRRADGTWNLNGVRRVLYRLPTLLGQRVVFVAESTTLRRSPPLVVSTAAGVEYLIDRTIDAEAVYAAQVGT